ncbi:hypothetical protein [Marinifilum sp.]|uniref:hypothetical protein n=1 Tax=Marinifilum sp. TaxID=2033137 RepID=UPI003BA85CDD
MNTNTLNKEPDVQLRSEMLPEVKSYYGVSQQWKTAISNVSVLGRGHLKCKITRPDSGSAKGGYVYLYKDEIGGVPVVREYFAGQQSGYFEIKSDNIDLYNGHYVLAYGPHFSDDVNILASTVQLDNGFAYNLESCLCSPISASINEATCYYVFASNVLGFSHYDSWVQIREGSVFGEGTIIAQTSIPKTSNRKGTKVIEATLRYGHTYNVCINLYSSVRPVAGYSFTMEE